MTGTAGPVADVGQCFEMIQAHGAVWFQPRYNSDGRRLAESWMDLLPDLDLNAPASQAEVQLRGQQHNAQQAALQAANEARVIEPWTGETEQVTYDAAIRLHKQAHRDLFPLSQNLIALIFISTGDLSQDQRQSLISSMTHRNRTMNQYRVGELRDVFIEPLCTEKTAVDNPMMNPSGSGGRRAFLILDEGENEDGTEGFLDELEDAFWTWGDNVYSWYQRRFQGRSQKRKGKGKRKRKRHLQEMKLLGSR